MSKRIALCSVALVLAVSLAAVWQAEGKQPENPDTIFGKKAALVYLKGRIADFAYVLEDARIATLEGKKVLEAVHADTGPDEEWLKGCKVYLAWDSVESIILFDDVEAYRKAIGEEDDTL
jgi:hypothetical protein